MDSTYEMLIVSVLVGLALACVTGVWRLFRKAGFSGRLALIPIRNVQAVVTMCGLPEVWFWYFLIGVGLIPMTFGFSVLVSLYVIAVVVRQLLRVFGQSDDVNTVVFACIGLPVVLAYLGWSSATYRGIVPITDVRVLPWPEERRVAQTLRTS
jgi:hypothetical protein